jgi:hypothetical protein
MKATMRSQATRLRKMTEAAAGSPLPPPKQCRICLVPEEVTMVGKAPNRTTQSNLAEGICRDREACEKRQPPLFGGVA